MWLVLPTAMFPGAFNYFFFNKTLRIALASRTIRRPRAPGFLRLFEVCGCAAVHLFEMSGLAEKDDEWLEKRREAPRDVADSIGVDQNGRPVYKDKCVVIPGTKRPDGTRRKDRRVRAEQQPDGTWKSFVPQDEVEKFETRRAGPPPKVPGAAPVGAAPAGSGNGFDKPMSKSAKKNAARKAAKALAAASTPAPAPAPAAAAEARELTPEEELGKKVKNLKKKLKQISELQTKVDDGLAPSEEQAEKLSRRLPLKAELKVLETRLKNMAI